MTPAYLEFAGRSRPGDGTKQTLSGGESAGQPKACEAQVGNQDWALDLAPDLWRRGRAQRGQ